jgi:uncharacterized protein YdeI (YjbR/CyaY-like superfamily)
VPVSPLNLDQAVPIATGAEFDAWLRRHGSTAPDIIVSFYKKSSGKQTVTVDQLIEAALCHGWIDTKGQRIDEERFALRFTPRRPRSNWSARNREKARRLLAEGRISEAGKAALPADL